MVKQIKTALDLQPDQENINEPTRRSYNDVYDSQEYGGWSRDIVVDKNGNIIAGNTSHQVYVDRGNEDVIVVQSDGTKMIVHQRTDIDLYDDEDDRARALSYYDNAATRHSQWKAENVRVAYERDRPLHKIFTNEELAALLSRDAPPAREPNAGQMVYTLSVTCRDDDDLSALASRLMSDGYEVKPVVKRGKV
jgi:hypothetical protein